MAFNVKVIEYPNGNIQARVFDDSVRENFEKPIKREKYEIEPFTYTKVLSTKYETKEEIEQKQEKSKYNSYTRCKNMIYTYARCVNWEWFITLTISPDSMDRYDFDICSKCVRRWLNNQRNRFAPDLKYLIVPEQHKDGAWHFHGLLADTGDMEFIDSGRVQGDDVIYNLSRYKYGFTTATKVKDVNRVSKYIGKYITKTLCANTTGKQRYFISQNIPKPIETNMILEQKNVENLISMLEESTGKTLTYISDKKEMAYNPCQYLEFN